MSPADRTQAVVAWIQRLKAIRVFTRYAQDRGPILASGLAYQALFAVFAALWVAFSVAGLVVSSDTRLQAAILGFLANSVPGLIDDGTGSGAIDPAILTAGFAFSLSGIVAILGLLFTALGWLASARDAVRVMFDLPAAPTNVFLLKLIDLALGLAFATLLLIAAVLSFAGSSLTEQALAWIGVDVDSVIGIIASRAVTLLIAVIVYAVALAGLYRVLARVRVPLRILRNGVLFGAIGVAALTVIGGLLLGGAKNNPLIASFAVIAGLLIYYNFFSQIVLVSATWMAVSVEDAGIVIDEKVAAARLERARALVQAHEPPPEPKRGFWARLFARRGAARDGGRRGSPRDSGRR
ncbi:MAG: YihY/virulence factor BrkB family protein [Pseudolysinimonas sp.]|uniref:YihY/virulence factor BrkB family protein n=1 Tax=Pseudolysinimonas sp. TaxID=2680009 RepID=UPI003264BB42